MKGRNLITPEDVGEGVPDTVEEGFVFIQRTSNNGGSELVLQGEDDAAISERLYSDQFDTHADIIICYWDKEERQVLLA